MDPTESDADVGLEDQEQSDEAVGIGTDSEVAASIADAVSSISGAVEAIGQAQKANAKAVGEAVKSANESGSKAVLEAISKISQPDFQSFGRAVADAISSMEVSQERCLRMVSDSMLRLSTAINRLATLEAREINLEMKSEAKKPAEYDFKMVYGPDGELESVKAVAIDGQRPPENALEAARRVK